MTLIRPDPKDTSRGQAIVLFALFLIVLLAITALAIDVTNAYATRRFYRAVADASSLAGAQDLQTTTRAITSANRAGAREHALQVLIDRLGASGPPPAGPCNGNVTNYSADFNDCDLPGTPYRITIETPSHTCVACDLGRAVQVTVRNPTFSLSFARLLGFSTWNVDSTSVAGLTFSSKYALITLRPPNPLPNGLDQYRQDIDVDGTNTRLNILAGDVGTNTSAVTNAGGRITLASGYYIDHIDDITPDPWYQDPVTGEPVGRLITNLILDPQYPFPTRTGAVTYANQAAGEDPACTGAPTGVDALPAGAVCYKPGIYSRNFNVQSGDVAYLESNIGGATGPSGAFFFDQGIDVRQNSKLLGGLISNQRGVVLVVPQAQTATLNAADAVWLNKGGSACSSNSCRALPALDASGAEMKTPAGLVITFEVKPGPADLAACFSGTTPLACSRSPEPNTLRMPGNGQLFVAGVIYAPSDNVTINGDNSGQTGVVGQIVSWTIKYAGGAELNQEYPTTQEIGVVRLDAACTAPSTACNP